MENFSAENFPWWNFEEKNLFEMVERENKRKRDLDFSHYLRNRVKMGVKRKMESGNMPSKKAKSVKAKVKVAKKDNGRFTKIGKKWALRS